MKTENFKSFKNALSRAEMKQIVAGTGGVKCTACSETNSTCEAGCTCNKYPAADPGTYIWLCG